MKTVLITGLITLLILGEATAGEVTTESNIIGKVKSLLSNIGDVQTNSSAQASIAEQELIIEKIALYAPAAISGEPDAFIHLKQLRERFDEILVTRERDLKTSSVNVLMRWRSYRRHLTTLIDSEEVLASIARYIEQAQQPLPELLTLSDKTANAIVRVKGDPQQVYIATRQLLILQRIQYHLSLLQTRQTKFTASTADQFGRDAAFFGRVLEGMLVGYEPMGIKAVTISEAVDFLLEIEPLFAHLSNSVVAILDHLSLGFDAQDAADAIKAQHSNMLLAVLEQTKLSQ